MCKKYECSICHKTIEVDNAQRLIWQKYGITRYIQFSNYKKFDFCKECFRLFLGWIKKHENK